MEWFEKKQRLTQQWKEMEKEGDKLRERRAKREEKGKEKAYWAPPFSHPEEERKRKVEVGDYHQRVKQLRDFQEH